MTLRIRSHTIVLCGNLPRGQRQDCAAYVMSAHGGIARGFMLGPVSGLWVTRKPCAGIRVRRWGWRYH